MLKNRKESPFNIFRHYKTSKFSFFFPKNFQCVQRVPSSIFFTFGKRMAVKKFPKGSPFTFFGTETVQNSHFSSDIRFSKHPTNNFFNTIRIFDVISELYCDLLMRKQMFGKSAPMWPSALYLNFRGVFGARKAGLGSFKIFVFSIKSPEQISKTLHFSSLKYRADFRRSRLVTPYSSTTKPNNMLLLLQSAK